MDQNPPGRDVDATIVDPPALDDDELGTPTAGRVLYGEERQQAIAKFLRWRSYNSPHFGAHERDPTTPIGKFAREWHEAAQEKATRKHRMEEVRRRRQRGQTIHDT